MRYRVLGPITVEVDGRAAKLGGPRQRMVLAVLLSRANQVVGQDTLIDAVWSGEPPEAGRSTLQSYVYGLRQVLGTDAIQRRGNGYVVDVDASSFDVLSFEAGVAEGHRLLDGDPRAARSVLVEALGLWFGAPYGGLEDEPELLGEVQRLIELRLDAIDTRIQADLALGQDGVLVGELETLVREYPLRERFWGHLMTALYRSGRQAEALRAFQQARSRLVEELGIEPGAELQQLEQAILDQDPTFLPARGSVERAFLFTDVEASTLLWEVDSDAAPAVLDEQDSIVAAAVEANGGSVFKRTGDGLYASFEDVAEAVAAAVDAQRVLAGTAWEVGPVRVRMAVGYGAAEWRAGEFAGLILHRVARVLATGHGGQVLVTAEVADRAGGTVETRLHGEYRLRGLGTPEVIHQLVAPGLETEFPPLRLDRPGTAAFDGVGGRTIRGYELRQPIGEGDFGVVYRAYQPSVGRQVAVKVIRPEFANNLGFVRRFEREAQIVAGLEHPHIVPLFDYWRDPDGAYLVMPLMSGGSLAGALRRGGWRLEPTLRLLEQVGAALAYAHRRGVLHRDLKSGNVLLDEDGNAYLSDFGIAARTTHADEVPVSSSRGFVAPEELAGAPHTVRSDIFSLGALTYHMLTGEPPTGPPVPDLSVSHPQFSAELGGAVSRATSTDPADRFGRVEDFLRDLRRAAGVDVVAASDLAVAAQEPARNPYKGLRAFGEDDAIDFHGRAALIDELLEKAGSRRLVAVVGPSGGGKSSVVRAGLVPALRAGAIPGSREWLITEMFPGSYPFEELEAALLRVAVDRPAGVLTDLQEPNGLLRVAKQLLPGDDSTLLLIVDQFEELFSSVRSEETRRAFLASLAAVNADERSRLRIILTMRADFLDRPLGYGDFAEAMAGGVITVGPPTRDGLAQAVAAPARTVGLDLEPGLVARIVGDVTGQPGALPLLQYALTEMFNRREGATLTIADYEAIGGVAGALGHRAEELYQGLNPSAREAARQVFLRLVTVTVGAGVTRRRVRQSELISLAVDRGGVEAVLGAFGGFRLLTFDRDPVSRGPTVEVAHEALLVEWDRLRSWLDDAQESLAVARRLTEAAQDWVEAGRDQSYLLRGARLSQVEEWTAASDVALAGDESELITASLGQREVERIHLRRRRRRLVASLAAGLVVVSVLAGVALVQRGVAEQEARLARVRELVSASDGHAGENPELAMLIAAEAYDLSVQGSAVPAPEAVSALARLITDWRLVGRLAVGDVPVMATTADGALIATTVGASDSDVQVVDVDGNVVSVLPAPAAGIEVGDVAFSPDGSRVAAAYLTTEENVTFESPEGVTDLVVFDVASGTTVSAHDLDGLNLSVVFSPSGEELALVSRSQVRIIDWVSGAETARFPDRDAVGRAHYLDDDRLLVTVLGEGVEVHSLSEGTMIEQIPLADLQHTTVDAAGSRLGYLADSRLRVVELASGDLLFDQAAPEGTLTLELSPDGSLLAYSGFDPVVHVERVEGDGPGLELAGSLGNVFELEFLDDSRLASISPPEVLVWDVGAEGAHHLSPVTLSRPQWGYQVSAEERYLGYFSSVSGGSQIGAPGDGFHLVDLETGEEVMFEGGELSATSAGVRLISPDFTLVGSLTSDWESSIRRLPTWESVKELDACRAALAFTSDNRRVLLSRSLCGPENPAFDAQAEAEVVDLATGETVLTIGNRYLYSAGFNPDGVFEPGRYLALTNQELVQVWDVAASTLVGELDRSELDEPTILNLTFDPSGRYLVGGSVSGRVWVVDLEQVMTGTRMVDAVVFERQAHSGAAPVPVMNADGVVATAGFDGVIRLWDVHSGRLLFEFESEMGIPIVRFTSDGSHLFYPDGSTVRRIPSDPGELRALAGDLLTRDFLRDECTRYADPDRCETTAQTGATSGDSG